MKNLISKYKNRTDELKIIAVKQKKIFNLTSFIRFLLFCFLVGSPFIFDNHYSFGFIATEMVLAGLFILSIRKNTLLKQNIAFTNELININEKEISALGLNMYQGDNGSEYIDANHPFSYDLDFFGSKSVFQFLNRTATKIGKKKLANLISNPLTDKNQIVQRQSAIKELSEYVDWRQEFQAKGNITSEENRNKNIADCLDSDSGGYHTSSENEDSVKITNWLDEACEFKNTAFIKYLLWILPILTICILMICLFSDLSINVLFSACLIQLSITGFYLKKINKVHASVSKQTDILNKYQTLLLCIENHNFKDKYLTDLQQKLFSDNLRANQKIKKLKNISKMLDNRMNLVYAIIANGFFMADLNYATKLEKWKTAHRNDFAKWFDVIATIDSLNSFANMAYNYPEFVFPVISKSKDKLLIKDGGHILIHPDERVNNDFDIDLNGQIVIITGANMAGKSTFLRTIGVNLVLAGCGAPVCAKYFEFWPTSVFTSIRMNDSLQEHESYFYAEIKRLKTIVEMVASNNKPFIIVDEMLKGTNSKDKQTGSQKFIEKLMKNNIAGIVATHDLELSKMQNAYENKIENYKFEVQIVDDKLIFDYKIQKGISQNLNATFLMKKYNIID